MIDRFQGEYRWLSNFWPVTVMLDGVCYPSVEHAYQAAKTEQKDERIPFASCALTPGAAKRLGRKLTIRKDWEGMKKDVMLLLLRQKFKDLGLKSKLLATRDREIIEGNDWNDTYWGVCRGKGKNNLGKLIMQVREELCHD